MFAKRKPLITRVDRGLYRRFDGPGDRTAQLAERRSFERGAQLWARTRWTSRRAVGRYLSDRDPGARYASFDYCFNHFQEHRTAVAEWGEPAGMEVSCLHLGFYLASWGMLRGSAELLQRSVRHLVPL